MSLAFKRHCPSLLLFSITSLITSWGLQAKVNAEIVTLHKRVLFSRGLTLLLASGLPGEAPGYLRNTKRNDKSDPLTDYRSLSSIRRGLDLPQKLQFLH